MTEPIASNDFSVDANRADSRARSNSRATWAAVVAMIGTLVFDYLLIAERGPSLSLSQTLVLVLVPVGLGLGAVMTRLDTLRHRETAAKYRRMLHLTPP
ncbi:hypothetical protein [Nitrospirillum amazonense]|uniref:hypothetical protein n=1 Tax=Nitrospirillum amazonense TaxID=28077 RepID=UPI002412D1E5|nr:hypothetical protein [Nitrospirillum amazonense]MDG3444627.1 hypothetical protein [Nitrospirillum amazonense]